MSIYQQRAKGFHQKLTGLKKRLTGVSLIRLATFILFVFFLYRFTQTGNRITILMSFLFFAVFFILIRWYSKLQQQKQFYAALARFNEDEEQFLQTNKSPYDTGKEYESPQHPYSYDLDLFSEGGLYGYLNRCSTPFGKAQLAQDLLSPDINKITERQQAIKELSGKIEFRQQLYAYGSLQESKKRDLDKLLQWVDAGNKLISRPLYYSLMVLPFITIGSLIYYFITENETAFSLFMKMFVLNLIVAGAFGRKIASQLSVSTSVTKILQNYSSQLKLIEAEPFNATFLKEIQQKLVGWQQPASKHIGKLSSLFNYLETVVNLVVSLFLNGLLMFHVHILYRLGHWKKQHALEVRQWLQIIGTIESLNSLANLSYNNPSFCFPQLQAQPSFKAEMLGHILVKSNKRVCNDVSFNQQKFVILTGSNMSGKSTFLRTLGTNLVLAKSGTAVCAKAMEFYPFEIFVSMRITDSLQDSESLFYAELKRLQSIIKSLEGKHKTFVILDEILRGTNSNDKRNGTIGLIRKMSAFNTFGIIATHDVVVAELIKEYPSFIANKAFESAIVNDELLFDYKLKDGVCNTLSATHLMKKMDII